MTRSADVEIEAVTHWFVRDSAGEIRPILKDVKLNVHPAEFVCLVGPSGCGKTTLLNMMAGVLRPAAGAVRVRIDGHEAVLPSKDVGYMLARDTLLPWRRTVENVELGLELRGTPKAVRRSRAREALRMVRLGPHERLYPSELSHGMRQRANLARMLVTDPALLLMDEPFGALDAQTRTHMQDEFLQIWEREMATVVFVTHDLQEAVLLADRVVAMVEGEIVKEVAVPFGRPRHPEHLRFDPAFQQLVRDLWITISEPAASPASAVDA